MSEQEFNKIFSQRLRHYMRLAGITQKELAEKLHVGTTSVYNWCNGVKSPRMDKVDKMCELFGCRRTDLMQDGTEDQRSEWYSDPETAAIAQELFENSDLRALMSAARDVTPEQLRATRKLLLSFKGITDDE